MSQTPSQNPGARPATDILGPSKDPVLNEDNPFEGHDGAVRSGILEEQGAFVIPDIRANAGGVTVSYFEWVRDRGGYFWNGPTVNERLPAILQRSFRDVLSVAQHHKVNMRTAAYMLAVERVAAVHRLRGMCA